MNYKAYLVSAILAAGLACQPRTTAEPDRPIARTADDPSAAARAAREEAEQARKALARRLDDLDNEVEKLEKRAEKASAKNRAKLEAQAREMRADARKLRDRMATWDDKVDSAWRTTKREVEDGLDKTENAIKNLVDDIKR